MCYWGGEGGACCESGPESVVEGASLKSGRQVREKASEVDRVVGGKHKIVWGNLQAMTDYGAIFKNYQAKTGLLESKHLS